MGDEEQGWTNKYDLVVSGGTHVLPGGVESVDLGVAGGKIVAIGARGSLAAIGAG